MLPASFGSRCELATAREDKMYKGGNVSSRSTLDGILERVLIIMGFTRLILIGSIGLRVSVCTSVK